MAACAVVGNPPAPPPVPPPPDPVVSEGPIPPARQAEASTLFSRAEEAFDAGRFQEAMEVSRRVVDEFPSAAVSGRALLLEARAAAATDSADVADRAAERYVGLLPPGDSRAASVRVLQARALAADPEASLGRLLEIDRAASPGDVQVAIPLARAAADSLDLPRLERVVQASTGQGPLAPIAEARLSAHLLNVGDTLGAERTARSALDGGAAGLDSLIAEGVLRGEVPTGLRKSTTLEIATVLPFNGSPSLADFARGVAEGIEVAASTVLGDRYSVDVRPFDDAGDPAEGAGIVGRLEDERIVGVVGFLQDEVLESAGNARTTSLPLVSPTARSAARGGRGVFSLEGPDPRAAEMIARYSASQGYARVAIIHSRLPESVEEADAFTAKVESFGIPVVGRFSYDPSATFYEGQILAARDSLRAAEIAALGLTEDDTLHAEMLEPVALFLPIPAEDVELVAPQITHFGLDTLAIDILGTSGWTDGQVLASVDHRHTDGVVATARVGAGPDSEGYRTFQEAYESHFQRSLVSAIPAIGYDAALLLLDALRDARSTAPEAVTEAFEGLRDVQGATGIFSVVGDRIVPLTEVVRIEGGAKTPVTGLPPG